MFSCNEKIVYPGHGVAVIDRIIERKVAGTVTQFFQLRFINKDMTILVPVASVNSVGIRSLCDENYVKKIYNKLSLPFKVKIKDQNITNWSKRNKEYQARLMSGKIDETCEIYRELKNIELLKELSFGEKSLLMQTEDLLVEEIVLVSQQEKAVILKKVRDSVAVMMQHVQQKVTQKQL